MSNGERARKLLASAREYLGFMETALANRSWNVAVREAAEVSELCLKGVLNYLLVDHPRVHDVGALFVQTLTERGIDLSDREAAEVRDASSRLAQRRAPTFYFEIDEDAKSAASAAENARRIHAFFRRIMAGIGQKDPGPRMPEPS